MDIEKYWKCCQEQDADRLKCFFSPHAYINWHNTNEHFTVDEFIVANCEYPGKWGATIERTEHWGDLIICVACVRSLDTSSSFHVTSFIKTENGLIASIDEYWGNDGMVPQWRLDKKIGRTIR